MDISNHTLHDDLRIPFIRVELTLATASYNDLNIQHKHELVEELLSNGPAARKFARTWLQNLLINYVG